MFDNSIFWRDGSKIRAVYLLLVAYSFIGLIIVSSRTSQGALHERRKPLRALEEISKNNNRALLVGVCSAFTLEIPTQHFKFVTFTGHLSSRFRPALV